MRTIKIAFHGANAANFRQGFETLIDPQHHIVDLSDALDAPGERAHYASAEVIVGVALNRGLPTPRNVRLFHAPAAGIDAIDTALLPSGAVLCNCFGHEQAIAEYVMAALLQRHVPLAQADADLREQRWTWWAGRPSALRSELGTQTLGLLGFGHIAQAILARAKAFGMRATVANRSPVADERVAQAFTLEQLPAFMASADAIVVSLPLTAQTTGIVGAEALAAMRPGALILNVGRGPVIDEQALFDALAQRRIGGAVIDTWYRYPTPGQAECTPSSPGLDFASLPNLLMTPHMSGWTTGTVRRRQETIAENIRRWIDGAPLMNRV
ncbi:2-hydroxyacid dehydrogenase [Verminephrobacter aporrectodeae]|uniref:2-hydroxyacid dehydrogenase n=1 Tax=Verminephrobacter aporrectodeae TaxID=1110389 RepID=UPI002243906F|nr:2-hydroxyacid dehydrogenase [Verminephrobacter aporrectodeae]MCW8175675.1 phosphoglycerate dehydrogenase [Verminephrobacter aporrectodeae subsp. tuberculatae]MCW8204724.1 phosphoglycerate dehydrogenase [Verminephrobacter aporrectodeae subsp. tuberculatae]